MGHTHSNDTADQTCSELGLAYADGQVDPSIPIGGQPSWADASTTTDRL